MIQVRVFFENQSFKGISVSGHEKNKQTPLICNSVSILTQTLAQSCFSLVNDKKFYLNSQKGLLELELKDSLEDLEKLKLQTLAESYLLGLRGLKTKFDSELNLEIVQA